VDPGELGNALIDRHLRTDHPLVLEGSDYFVVSAVARSAALTVHASGQAETGGTLEVEALEVASANTGVKVRRQSDTSVTYEGETALVFGVELYELVYDRDRGAFLMLTPKGPLHTYGALPPELEPSLIGGEEAFLELAA
jgi:hypothetical protein